MSCTLEIYEWYRKVTSKNHHAFSTYAPAVIVHTALNNMQRP